MLPEFLASSRANNGAAALDNVGHGVPVGLHNVVAAVHHALVALVDEEDSAAKEETGPDHGTDCAVHS